MKIFQPKTILLLTAFLLAVISASASSGIKLIENKGQWAKNILYRAFIPGGTFYVEQNRLTYFFYDISAIHSAMHDHVPTDSVKCHVVRVNFKGANIPSGIVTQNNSFESYNYIHGKDPSKWASNAKAYGKVTLKNLWSGIDLEIDVQDEALKYNFIVSPNSDPSQIKLEYEGAGKTYLEDAAFHIKTTLTHIKEDKPVAFQADAMAKVAIKCNYTLNKNTLGFKVSGYNPNFPLTIDPLVIFATFSGSFADNWGFTGTYDNDGYAYSGGTVYDPGYPTTTGAFQEKFQGGNTDLTDTNGYVFANDAGILKYSPDGKKLIWATYLGGSDNEQPQSMIINKDGELVIFGTTYSKDFPVTAGSVNTSYSGNGDMFICKITKDGSSLSACTYFGGTDKDGMNGPLDEVSSGLDGPLAYNYGDHYRGEVLIDSSDNIYISSCTRSGDFPVKGAFQSSLNGKQDACVIKFNSDLSGVLWSTFLGGSDEDAGYGINMDRKGNVFVTGGTESADFPGTSNGEMSSYGGNIDGFISKISPDGKQLMVSTYVGTSSYDQSYLVQIDNMDRIFITGQTKGEMSTVGNVYSNAKGKQFISAYTDDLSNITLSTVFGTGRNIPDISPSAFLVDHCGRICVAGWGGYVNEYYNGEFCSTNKLETTPDAFQKTTDGSDFYVIVFGKDLSTLVYASFFGGDQGGLEHVDGGTSRFDANGIVYESVCGGCGGYSDFPTTAGAWSRTNNGKRPKPITGGGCNNAMFKMDLNSSNYPPAMRDTTIIGYGGGNLEYDFELTDRDVTDSIYASSYGTAFNSKLTNGPVATLNIKSGVGKIYGSLNWKTICSQFGPDTYYVYVNMHDNGCPVAKSSLGLIKIVLKPPLPIQPPGIFCIQRSVDNNNVTISWGDYKQLSYLKEYRLVKVLPNGSMRVVKTFNQQVDNTYTDDSVPDFNKQDYCYFIYGVNTCGIIGDSSRMECTAIPSDSIPASINIHSVTVINNSSIKVSWERSFQKDFYYYKLYRKRNIDNEEYVLYQAFLKDLNDTVYIDNDVDVQNISYSYKVIMGTQCGLTSSDGRYGASIVLRGFTAPFENHLYWNPYMQWQNGVGDYEIFRRDTGSQFISMYHAKSAAFVDDSLNYEWGLYHYKIIAHENGNDGGSESNELQLIQSPVIYAANVFTPNGDSLNDAWIPTMAFVKDIQLKVFDRWGSLVWQSGDKKSRWQGKYLDNDPFNNVFIWQAQYTGWDKSNNYKLGNITILK